jgi:hypothetical protein
MNPRVGIGDRAACFDPGERVIGADSHSVTLGEVTASLGVQAAAALGHGWRGPACSPRPGGSHYQRRTQGPSTRLWYYGFANVTATSTVAGGPDLLDAMTVHLPGS